MPLYGAQLSSAEVLVSTGAGVTVATGAGILLGFRVKALGTTPTVTIYNNTTAAAPVLLATTDISTYPVNTIVYLSVSIPFTTGCHVVVGGTGTTTIAVLVK